MKDLCTCEELASLEQSSLIWIPAEQYHLLEGDYASKLCSNQRSCERISRQLTSCLWKRCKMVDLVPESGGDAESSRHD